MTLSPFLKDIYRVNSHILENVGFYQWYIQESAGLGIFLVLPTNNFIRPKFSL